MDYQDFNFPLDTDHLLALSLSAPPPSRNQSPTFTVQLADEGVDFSIRPQPSGSGRVIRVLASKETIAFSILLNRLYHELQPSIQNSIKEYPRSASVILREALSEVAEEHIYLQHKYSDVYLRGRERFMLKDDLSSSIFFQPGLYASRLLERLDLKLDFDVLKYVDERTHEVLASLEEAGLVRDPWSTGATGVMVLVGLVPVRWSVRTPKGQGIYREIKIRAGFWTLDIKKCRRGNKKWADWDFNFRGVQTVRKLLKGLAEDFLADDGDDTEADLD